MTNHFHFLCEHFISEDAFLSLAVARHLFVSIELTVWRCVIDYSEVNSKLPTWSWHTFKKKKLLKLKPAWDLCCPKQQFLLSWHFPSETASGRANMPSSIFGGHENWWFDATRLITSARHSRIHHSCPFSLFSLFALLKSRGSLK